MEDTLKLPESFIFCYAYLEDRTEEISPFTIYGKDGKPWLTLSIWQSNEKIFLWSRLRTTWVRMMNVERFQLNYWLKICILVDSSKGNITVSFNGKSASKNVEELSEQMPEYANENIKIGLSDSDEKGPVQFYGAVSNIKLFDSAIKKNINDLTLNLCEHDTSSLIFDKKWNIRGNVTLEDEENWKICNKTETVRIAIGDPLNWFESMDICERLGHGELTEIKSTMDLIYTLELFQEQKDANAACDFIWTPISDEKAEGDYLNARTNVKAVFLPWRYSEPNGGNKENFVLLKRSNKQYIDNVATKSPSCAVCDISFKTQLYLRGVCKHTYLGKIGKIPSLLLSVIIFKKTLTCLKLLMVN